MRCNSWTVGATEQVALDVLEELVVMVVGESPTALETDGEEVIGRELLAEATTVGDEDIGGSDSWEEQ